MDERAGPGQVIGKGCDGQTGAVQDFSVNNRLSVRGNQSLHGKSDAEDLCIRQSRPVPEKKNLTAYFLKIGSVVPITDGADFVRYFLSVQIDRNDFNFILQNFGPDTDAEIRYNAVSICFPAYVSGIDPTVLCNQTVFFQFRQLLCDSRAAQMKMIGNILLSDLFCVIDVLINQITVVFSDLIRCNTFLRHSSIQSLKMFCKAVRYLSLRLIITRIKNTLLLVDLHNFRL